MTWKLNLGSCLDPVGGLASLADKSVDVVITDPPYDEHTHTKGRRGASIVMKCGAHEQRNAATRAAISRNRDLGFAALKPEEMAAAGLQFGRLARRWVLVFCTVEMVSDWKRCLEAGGLRYIRTCAWHKLGSTPQFTGDRPAQAFECIVVAHAPGRTKWNAHGKHGYYAHPIVLERGHGEVRLHTTQKPITLMRELVEDFTNPGDLVLDAYAGSGTTALACMQLGRGRRSIGWEENEITHAIATRRLNGDEARPRKEQPGLFDALQETA
jgi:hypothetical protein